MKALLNYFLMLNGLLTLAVLLLGSSAENNPVSAGADNAWVPTAIDCTTIRAAKPHTNHGFEWFVAEVDQTEDDTDEKSAHRSLRLSAGNVLNFTCGSLACCRGFISSNRLRPPSEALCGSRYLSLEVFRL